MISTRNLSALPTIEQLIQLTKSLATLDAVIERNWQWRYYSFNSRWDENEQLASMRNGEGDAWFCVFGPQGAFLKGFDHECIMARRINDTGTIWPEVLSEVPKEFEAFAKEPAFSMQETTFSIWRGVQDHQWRKGRIEYPEGNDPDGSAKLLRILDRNPNTYRQWAEGYYRRPISLRAVEHIYSHWPLTDAVVRELNVNIDMPGLSEDLKDIGYPLSAN
jgi:hypothetical protein